MKRIEFINKLSSRLSSYPEEREKTIEFYEELITDGIEDGLTEEEVIESFDDMDVIINNILIEMPMQKIVKGKIEKSKNKSSNKTLWIILVLLGSPIWVPLAIVLASVILVIYIVIWTMIITFFAVEFSFAVGAIGLIVGGIMGIFTGALPYILATIGAGITLFGIALLMFKPLLLIAKKLVHATGLFGKKIKSMIIGKGGN